jgi:hypothetical protein
MGPMLAIRLGWNSPGTSFLLEGTISLLMIFGLTLPIFIKVNKTTILLFCLGFVGWCVVGVLSSQILYA